MTTFLLATITWSPDDSIPHQISSWATFLGVTSAILATIQYAPQILHTYRMKLVGALSIPMMLIQTPGGFLVVISIVLRPGTNWTSMRHNSSLPLFKLMMYINSHRLDNICGSRHPSRLPSCYVYHVEVPPTETRYRWLWQSASPVLPSFILVWITPAGW